MAKQPTRIRAREIEVERLVILEPGGGRVRAVIETVAGKRGRAATVRLSLFAPDGTPALVAQVGADGDPQFALGDPDHGDALLLTRRALDLWAGGNTVIAIWTRDEAGHVQVMDDAGTVVFGVPEPDGV